MSIVPKYVQCYLFSRLVQIPSIEGYFFCYAMSFLNISLTIRMLSSYLLNYQNRLQHELNKTKPPWRTDRWVTDWRDRRKKIVFFLVSKRNGINNQRILLFAKKRVDWAVTTTRCQLFVCSPVKWDELRIAREIICKITEKRGRGVIPRYKHIVVIHGT